MENHNPWHFHNSSKARLVTVTPNAEEIIGYVARVTSKDQSNPNVSKLLKYCIKHKHWSVFEQASMTVEVVTPLAISIQALRHTSFRFQQFSGRYEDQAFMANHTEGLSVYRNILYLPPKVRLQDTKNRQNSIEVQDGELHTEMNYQFHKAYEACLSSYKKLLEMGIAKELSRFVLPEGVFTRLYITGNIRSFIHYIQVREDEGVAQAEHVELAKAVREVFESEFPTIYRAVFEEKELTPVSEIVEQPKTLFTHVKLFLSKFLPSR